MDRLAPIKVFCPVCDAAFSEESLVFEHLETSHELRTQLSTSQDDAVPAVRGKGFALDEDWVVVEVEEDDDDFLEIKDDELWLALPSDGARKALLRKIVPRPEKFFLDLQLGSTFPNGLPERFFDLPMFGSSFPESVLCVVRQHGFMWMECVSHCVIWQGEKQLLCVVAHHFPQFRFCPVLPSLLSLLWHALDGDADTVLSLLYGLLERKERLGRAGTEGASPVSMVATSETQLRMLVSATNRLVQANCKAVRRLEASPAVWLDVCHSFFPLLPPSFREHALLLWQREVSSTTLTTREICCCKNLSLSGGHAGDASGHCAGQRSCGRRAGSRLGERAAARSGVDSAADGSAALAQGCPNSFFCCC